MKRCAELDRRQNTTQKREIIGSWETLIRTRRASNVSKTQPLLKAIGKQAKN